MKKNFCKLFLCFVVIFNGAIFGICFAGNLVTNSSFELGFKGWGDEWDDKTFIIDDTTAFHGKHSLKLI